MDDQFLKKVETMRGVRKSLQDLMALIPDFLNFLSTAFHTDEAKLLQPEIEIFLLLLNRKKNLFNF